MKLEEVVETYGMYDYYDMTNGYTYKLSEASDKPCEGVELKSGQLRVLFGPARISSDTS